MAGTTARMPRAAASPRWPLLRAARWAGDGVATVVLGDDHVVFLDALATVLSQHGHLICGVARTTAEMVTRVSAHQPDVCLIDRNAMANGQAQAIGLVLAASASTGVLVLGADPGSEAAEQALDAGASGYLHQSRGVGALVSALDRVLNGEIVVDVPQAAPSRAAEPNQALRMAAHLTSRERECLMMLVEGLDTAAMVDRLGVSRTTVRTHLQAVLTKLGVHSRLEAASFAVRHRLPDLWSGEDRLATATAVRGTRTVARAPGMAAATAAVRPIRLRRVDGIRGRIVRQPMPVAAGSGAGAG
jgi:two-component system, NarL family, nitrate/nitrite response regulator NarL